MGLSQQALTPEQLQMQNQYSNLQKLKQAAITPNANAGAVGGLGQLATALMANQAQKNWQKKWGVAPPQAPGAPGSSAASGAPGAAGNPGSSDAD